MIKLMVIMLIYAKSCYNIIAVTKTEKYRFEYSEIPNERTLNFEITLLGSYVYYENLPRISGSYVTRIIIHERLKSCRKHLIASTGELMCTKSKVHLDAESLTQREMTLIVDS